jgi:hypothetical protein
VASKPGPIPAGGRDKISVVVHTTNKGGSRLRKDFTVFTNDPKRSRIELIVTGTVLTFAQIDPPRADLIGHQGELLSTTVRLLPRRGYPFKVKEVKASGDRSIAVTLHPLGKNPLQDGYRLVVTSKRSTVGAFGGSIVVHTDSKIKPTFYIPVKGRIRHRPPDRTKS